MNNLITIINTYRFKLLILDSSNFQIFKFGTTYTLSRYNLSFVTYHVIKKNWHELFLNLQLFLKYNTYKRIHCDPQTTLKTVP